MGSTDQGKAPPPRVSVICPFFEAGRFLDSAIASVLGQDFADFELLLVDDGSSDAGTAIARRHAAGDRRVRYLEHPGHANRGTCASRNLALREAKAPLIAFIDADDVWRPHKLAEQVALMDAMPETDALFGAVNYWGSHDGGDDRVIQTGHAVNRLVRPPEALLKIYPLGRAAAPCPSDMMIRRALVERIGGFEEEFVGRLFLYEDQAFLTKVYANGTTYFSDRVWLDYRLHPASCTATGARDGLGWEARRYCLNWLEAYLARSRFRFDPRVRLALFNALRPYRHPHLSRIGRSLRRLLRRAEAA